MGYAARELLGTKFLIAGAPSKYMAPFYTLNAETGLNQPKNIGDGVQSNDGSFYITLDSPLTGFKIPVTTSENPNPIL